MKKPLLYFNLEDKIFAYHLPAINNRRFNIDLASSYTVYPCKISLEVWDNIWYIKQTDDVEVSVDGNGYNMIRLDTGMLLHIHLKESEESFSVMVLEESEEVTEFRKYSLVGKNEIIIGVEATSDIVISQEFVSRNHALMFRREDGFYIKDTSKNGTYLNGQRLLGTMKLRCFDEIYILGVKIVYLGELVAMNHADVVHCNLPSVEIETDCFPTDETFESQKNGTDLCFSRSPRNMEPLMDSVVEIEAPPANQKQKQQPLLFILGPSVTMPIPIMMSVLFNMRYNSNSSGSMMYLGTLVSVLSSTAIGAMWALAHRWYNKKQEKETEELRVNGYRKYIEQNEQLLESQHKYNKQILANQFFSTAELIRMPEENKHCLWNRNINHKDFLTVRVGKGKILFPGKIVIPKERFSLTEDELSVLPYKVYDKFKYMEDAVSTVNLCSKKLWGVTGSHENVMNIARILTVQIAALHCYTDVKMAFLYSDHDAKEVEWMKWLPHVFSSDKKVRFLAKDSYSYQNVLFELTGELRNREEKIKQDSRDVRLFPHYIVFCTEKELLEKEAIQYYMTSTNDYGFTFILLYDTIDRLPNECTEIIGWDEDFAGIFSLDKSKDEASTICFETVQAWEAEAFAKKLSGIYVNESAGGEIPSFIDFMEMLQIGKIEQWDLMKHYKENRVYEGIRAMIGMTHGNQPMYLDIHEKKYGPHGLVAGTTGSGKSETIMTFILSLAMNYHPDEVAFVLIDYKGGGMAAPFVGMPHTAGTITNIGNDDETESIDENQTRRALISIKSEIKRRQKVFSKNRVNHIDAYIRMYRDGQVEEPLPHLIIISDEFAELKKEQPEFIKELVSAARVGRSLGIHLILATQKPAGVVDDEIWSNSRFKICLRVQDKQDSMGMLKRPEAASLTGTGRAYLQIGNDEIFEQFQSGYAGASYEPKEELELSQHNEVSMIGLDGSRLVIPRKKQSKGSVSQLDACIRYIKKVAEENLIQGAKPLWLPPLEDKVYLEEILSAYSIDMKNGLVAVFGLIDQPEQQRQYPAVIDLTKIANLLITGNIGMGKTTLLQTILYSLVTRYAADECSIYCMDFSSRTFRIFSELPHCGGVVFSEEEEAVGRMISLISKTVEERRILFETAGVGSFIEYLGIKRIPLILLCIDNYAMFKELYQDYEEQLSVLLREGTKYGIQIIVTANSVSDLNFRIRQYFSFNIPLFLGEKGKYMDVFGVSPDFLPSNRKGRGLLYSGTIVEFQTALSVHAETELDRNREIQKRFADLLKSVGKTRGAARVKTLPRNETYEEFINKFDRKNEIPLGYNINNLEMEGISLEDNYCYCVSAVDKRAIASFIDNIYTYCTGQGIEIQHVVSNDTKNKGDIPVYSREDLTEWVIQIRSDFVARSATFKTLGDEMTPSEKTEVVVEKHGRKVVIIDDLLDFVEAIYLERNPAKAIFPVVETLLTKGKGYGIHFIAGVDYMRKHEAKYLSACETFLQYHTGVHFGGKLDQQKLFECKLPYPKQIEILDFNVGSYLEKNELKQVLMPVKEGTQV